MRAAVFWFPEELGHDLETEMNDSTSEKIKVRENSLLHKIEISDLFQMTNQSDCDIAK